MTINSNSKKKWWMAFMLLVAACNTALAETLFIKDQPQAETQPQATERSSDIWVRSLIAPMEIPRVNIYDEMQQPVMLKDFKGNLVIVMFWASWCLQCVEELQILEQLSKDLKYNDITNIKILPVSIDFKTQEFQQELLKSNDINELPYYSDKNKELMSYMGVHSLPTSFVIDTGGKIVVKTQQHLNWNDPIIYKELTKMAGPSAKQ